MDCDMDLTSVHANPELDWCKRTKCNRSLNKSNLRRVSRVIDFPDVVGGRRDGEQAQ
jgi:hypothetical protein